MTSSPRCAVRRAMRPGSLLHAAAATLLAACSAPPTDKELAYQAWDQQRAALKHELASSELREGRLEQAATLAREAVSLSPSNPAHAELLAQASMARGDFAAARSVLVTACHANPDAAQAAYLLGTLDEREQNWPRAIESFGRAAAARPDILEYHLALAQARARLEGIGPARDGLLLVYDRFASEPLYHLGCAELARLEGDLTSACAAYEAALRLGCDDLPTRQALGLCCYWLGRYRAAAEQLSSVVVRVNVDPAAMAAYGGSLLALGRDSAATDWLARFVTQRPDDEQLWLLLGQAQARMGDVSGARRAALEALRAEPRSARVACVAAAILVSVREWEAALGAARAAVRLDGENAEAQLLLGRAAERLGDCGAARRAYEEAWLIDPRNSAAPALLAAMDR